MLARDKRSAGFWSAMTMTTKIVLELILDTEMLPKVGAYYLYRSKEINGGRPIVDGVYVQRATLGDIAPEHMNLTLEWKNVQPANHR
jgi:hypothetical protein